VALKCDLRSTVSDDANGNGFGDGRRSYISYDEGLQVAQKIGALRYLECSAKKNRGVNECFTEAARCALSAKPKGNVTPRDISVLYGANIRDIGAKDDPPDSGCKIM
jgi:GTPase SAR1 family protein